MYGECLSEGPHGWGNRESDFLPEWSGFKQEGPDLGGTEGRCTGPGGTYATGRVCLSEDGNFFKN